MSLTEISGNILESDAHVLVNTINIVGVAGAGLALAFREKHPDWYYHYKKLCRRRQLTMDDMFLYIPEGGYPYKILSVLTKDTWRNPSDLRQIECTIQHIARWLISDNIISIAIPALGCQNGGLSYQKQVRPLLLKYLSDSPADVRVYAQDD